MSRDWNSPLQDLRRPRYDWRRIDEANRLGTGWEIKAPLAFGRRKSHLFTSDVIPQSFRGINLFTHGEPITPFESKNFMRNLERLTRDYPDVHKHLHEIHLFTDINHDEVLNWNETQKLLSGKDKLRSSEEVTKVALKQMGALGIATPQGVLSTRGAIGIDVGAIRAMKGITNEFEVGKPASTMSLARTGKASRLLLGRVLNHEFGHAVQFSQAYEEPNLGAVGDVYSRAEGLRIHRDILKTPKEEIPNIVNETMKMTEEQMGPRLWTNEMLHTGHHSQYVIPLLRKHFPDWDMNAPTPIVGSTYALTNPKELFAEIFARSRIRGEGSAEAKAFEQEIRAFKKEKMLKEVQSAAAALGAMRR